MSFNLSTRWDIFEWSNAWVAWSVLTHGVHLSEIQISKHFACCARLFLLVKSEASLASFCCLGLYFLLPLQLLLMFLLHFHCFDSSLQTYCKLKHCELSLIYETHFVLTPLGVLSLLVNFLDYVHSDVFVEHLFVSRVDPLTLRLHLLVTLVFFSFSFEVIWRLISVWV